MPNPSDNHQTITMITGTKARGSPDKHGSDLFTEQHAVQQRRRDVLLFKDAHQGTTQFPFSHLAAHGSEQRVSLVKVGATEEIFLPLTVLAQVAHHANTTPLYEDLGSMKCPLVCDEVDKPRRVKPLISVCPMPCRSCTKAQRCSSGL